MGEKPRRKIAKLAAFEETHSDRISDFLQNGFSEVGDREIRILVREAEKNSKNLDILLALLDWFWLRLWCSQIREVRADPSDGENKDAFAALYAVMRLQIPAYFSTQ